MTVPNMLNKSVVYIGANNVEVGTCTRSAQLVDINGTIPVFQCTCCENCMPNDALTLTTTTDDNKSERQPTLQMNHTANLSIHNLHVDWLHEYNKF